MQFGKRAVDQAYGAILAHTVRLDSFVLKKGKKLTLEDCEKLSTAGLSEVTVARLDADDLHEDEAAIKIATAAAGNSIRAEAAATGRSNLYAEQAGLLLVDRSLIDQLNRIDPAITIATLDEHAPVEAGRMVATVKIIPFAVPRTHVFDALHSIGERGQPLDVQPYRPLRVALISTTLPGLKPQLIDKTTQVLKQRLAPAAAPLIHEAIVDHDEPALEAALKDTLASNPDLIIVFGASAIVDQGDVIPAALKRAGGETLQFGMPVDPGNLLLLGELDGTPLLGAPGCARSPKENGFDWVLSRLLAGINVTQDDIIRMGVGGLLMDIVSRPRPRDAQMQETQTDDQRKIAAVILAAGRASRMGGPNKLLAEFDGEPQIRRIVLAALHSQASEVVVVTGHQASRIEKALTGLNVRFVHNSDYANGLSTSVRTGIEALEAEADAALVILSDMPKLTAEHFDHLIDAYQPDTGAHIVLASTHGKRGNPVLWSRRFFRDLIALEGDTGARHLLASYAESLVEVDLGAAASVDIDTPEALKAAGGTLPDTP